jgi:hypothetical protein
MLIPIVQGGHAINSITIDITSSTSNYNILTAATAAGYNAATDTTPIIVNVATSVVVSGSGTYAMRTGVLNASSSLTINITGSINGYTGADGTAVANVGSVGGDAVYWETDGTSIVNVLAGAYLQGGGGGGGGGGQRGIRAGPYDSKYGCSYATPFYGSYGTTGAAGGFGLAGATGGTGTYGGGSIYCPIQSPGGGGLGGAAGFALRKNGRTVTVNNSGTVAGSTA